jgi:oligoribonuclease (3'-5' exoribonuclease)
VTLQVSGGKTIAHYWYKGIQKHVSKTNLHIRNKDWYCTCCQLKYRKKFIVLI